MLGAAAIVVVEGKMAEAADKSLLAPRRVAEGMMGRLQKLVLHHKVVDSDRTKGYQPIAG